MRTTGIVLGTLLAVVLLASCTATVQPTLPTAGDLYLDTAPIPAPAQGKGTLDVQIVPVEIGGMTGHPLAWSFAVLPDVHADTSQLTEAVSLVAENAGDWKIKFVIVLGDLIQGEKDTEQKYRGEFEAVKNILDTLPADIPYIPLIGNHDVWCNLSGGDITLPDDKTIVHPYTSSVYPEEIFDDIFGDVYESLKENTMFTNWDKQDMPAEGLTNPTDYPHAATDRVPTYLQNFAFDYEDWHFVCADFCARDDFDPPDWDFDTDLPDALVHPPYPKCQFGYASLLWQYGGDSTTTWVENHLKNYTGSRNIFLLSHHPPVFSLHSSLFGGMYYCDMVGHNTFAFNQTDYDTLVNVLNEAATDSDCTYHYWFAGHYHVADMDWADTTIESHTVTTGDGEYTPVTQVGVIPSVLRNDWSLLTSGTATINGAYDMNPQANNNGYIGAVSIYEWTILEPVT